MQKILVHAFHAKDAKLGAQRGKVLAFCFNFALFAAFLCVLCVKTRVNIIAISNASQIGIFEAKFYDFTRYH